MIPTPGQIRAARQLLNLSQADLVSATGLSMATVKRVESERDVPVSQESIAAIQAALEAAGVVFLDGNGEGVGVRLRSKKK